MKFDSKALITWGLLIQRAWHKNPDIQFYYICGMYMYVLYVHVYIYV